MCVYLVSTHFMSAKLGGMYGDLRARKQTRFIMYCLGAIAAVHVLSWTMSLALDPRCWVRPLTSGVWYFDPDDPLSAVNATVVAPP